MNQFKQWLVRRKEIVNYVQEHFDELKSAADNSDNIRYSTRVSGIGCFSPSLINHIIHSSYKKGRLLKNKPDSPLYTEFTLNQDGKPLRMRDINKFGCDLTAYFYSDDEYTYSVPLFRDTKNDYGKNIFAYRVMDGKVIEYAEIEDSFLYLELYTYPDNSSDMAVCEMFEYLDFSVAYSQQSKEEEEARNALFAFLTQKAEEKNEGTSQKISIPSVQSKPKLNKFKYIIHFENNKVSKVKEFYNENDDWKSSGFVYNKK